MIATLLSSHLISSDSWTSVIKKFMCTSYALAYKTTRPDLAGLPKRPPTYPGNGRQKEKRIDLRHVGGGYWEGWTSRQEGWRRWKSWISWRPAALMGGEGGLTVRVSRGSETRWREFKLVESEQIGTESQETRRVLEQGVSLNRGNQFPLQDSNINVESSSNQGVTSIIYFQ